MNANSSNNSNGNSGYLYKYSKRSDNHWKKRLFLLKGSILGYYGDKSSVDALKIYDSDPNGELLLFAETNVLPCSFEGMAYAINLAEPFAPLMLACDSEKERQVWIKHLKNSIAIAKLSLRQYAYRRNESQGIAKKKYFILHQSCITYHKNADDLSNVQGFIHLDKFSSFCYNDNYLSFNIVDNKSKKSMSIQFKVGEVADQTIYNQWKKNIIQQLMKVGGEIMNLDKSNSLKGNFIVKEGPVLVKPLIDSPESAEDWPRFTLRLTDTELLVIDSLDTDDLNAQVTEIQITPNCSVFETNLGPNSFEIVSSKRVMHFMADSTEETNEWLDAIRAVISNSYLDTTDPIFQQALFRIDEDYFYEIEFPEKKLLGIVFERSNDWAIVKHSPCADQTGVRPGYVLSAIDGESVLLEPYQNVLDKLRNWQPPLLLGFRVPPEKNGFLLKESKSRRTPSKSVWKRRYFIISGGALTYKETAESDRVVSYPLMGSAVSLVTPQDVGKFFCFKIISGVGSVVMQSSSERSMMDWASTLYHAIAMANGGGHILQYERDRVNATIKNESESLLINNLKGSSDSWIGRPPTSSVSDSNNTLAAVMRRAKVDNTAELEQAILVATSQNINVSGAVKLLEEININRTSIDELQINLTTTMANRSLHELEKVIAICEEVGIIDCHDARVVVDKLKAESIEKELIESCQQKGLTSEWTLEHESRIVAAIDVAKNSQLVEVSPHLINAQMKLIQLRRAREEKESRRQVLVSAIHSNIIPRIESAMKDALNVGFRDDDTDILQAKNIIELAQVTKLEATIQKALAAADICHYANLQEAITEADIANITVIMNSEVYNSAVQRLQKLISLQPAKAKVLEDISVAVEGKIIEKLEVALKEASSLQLSCQEVHDARSALVQFKSDAELVAYKASVAEQKKRVAEEERAKIDAAEKALDAAIASSKVCHIDIAIDAISVALQNAKLYEVSQAQIDNGHSHLEQLKQQRQQNDDDKRMNEERIIAEINHAIQLHDGEMIELAYDHALAQSDLKLDQHPVVQGSLDILTDLRIEELQIAIDESRTSVDVDNFDNLKQILRKAEWLETLIAKRSNKGTNQSFEVKNESFAYKLRLAKDHLKNLESLKQHKSESELALERVLREVPLSVQNLEHALEVARNAKVSNALIKHVSDILSGLIISNAERKLINAMKSVDIDNLESLKHAIEHAKEKKVDSYKLHEAIEFLAKIERFVDSFNMALDSKDIDEIESALIEACNLNLEGHTIIEASKLLKELRKDNAAERLAFAMSEANVNDFDILVDALNDAKLCDIDKADLNDAQVVLDALMSQKETISSVTQALSNAISKQDIAELKSLLSKADQIGYKGEVYEGANSLLLILIEADAAAKLDEAVNIDYKNSTDFDQLSIAIQNAERVGVRIEKIDDAKNLLNNLIKNRDELAYCTQLLRAAMTAKSIDNLHVALDRAEGAPDFDEDLLEEAIELLNSLEYAVRCERIMILLNDAIRVKSIKSLSKAIARAEAANITDPTVATAKTLLAELEEEQNKMGTVTSTNDANDDDDEDDVLNDTLDLEITSPTRPPRKLARRKSKRYSFNSKDAATAEDLYKVFYNHGIKAGTDRHSGFLNPMQFSNIWRLITSEKGNLFKEMQMFKKFDTSGIGALSSEDFVLGFINLAHEQKNDDLLKRIKSLASDDNLIIDNEDASPSENDN